ncbi:MAG TPA: hypothetical protein VL633_06025 [Bacteroidota bacterium]|jgi:hypothetical protein|nr:hypothetical protein [Bacteroidota bacterium]
MNKQLIAICTTMLVLTGCGGSTYISNNDPDAKSAIQRADSLARVSTPQSAAAAYADFAEQYPHSCYYKAAVRNAAFFHCDPLNTELDEPAALHWFQVYRDLGISGNERQEVDACIGLLKRNIALRSKMSKKAADLEQQVKYANEEIRKLKDVDVKIHERKTKK